VWFQSALQVWFYKCIQIFQLGQAEIYWRMVNIEATLLWRPAEGQWSLNVRRKKIINFGQKAFPSSYTFQARDFSSDGPWFVCVHHLNFWFYNQCHIDSPRAKLTLASGAHYGGIGGPSFFFLRLLLNVIFTPLSRNYAEGMNSFFLESVHLRKVSPCVLPPIWRVS